MTTHALMQYHIRDCTTVAELLDIAATCISTSRLLARIDEHESSQYQAHAQHALRRVGFVRAAEEAAA